MAEQAVLNRALSEFTRTIIRRYDIGDVLYQLTDQAAEILDVAGAGVCLMTGDGRLRFVTATDDMVTEVEGHQIEAAEGPCHDAARTGQAVIVPDLNTEQRWPDYTAAAIKAGCQSVAGLPLHVEDRSVGALNVYHVQPWDWPAEDIATAQILADMASGYILNARELEQSKQLATQLQHALDSRVVVEQAKGVIAARAGIPTDEAFQRLRRHARDRGARVHDVARAVVSGELEL
jgi:GAF domain-containing protein